jgi:hypothetical protein
MKVVLPRLQMMLHDRSARVRRVFVRLLVGIRDIKTIAVADVVPVSHLHARLVADADIDNISSLLVRLLLPTVRIQHLVLSLLFLFLQLVRFFNLCGLGLILTPCPPIPPPPPRPRLHPAVLPTVVSECSATGAGIYVAVVVPRLGLGLFPAAAHRLIRSKSVQAGTFVSASDQLVGLENW